MCMLVVGDFNQECAFRTVAKQIFSVTNLSFDSKNMHCVLVQYLSFRRPTSYILLLYLCFYFYLHVEQVWKYNVEDQTGQESVQFTSKANGLPRGQSGQSELPPFLVKFCKGQVGRMWVILVLEEVKNTEAIQDYEVQEVFFASFLSTHLCQHTPYVCYIRV